MLIAASVFDAADAGVGHPERVSFGDPSGLVDRMMLRGDDDDDDDDFDDFDEEDLDEDLDLEDFDEDDIDEDDDDFIDDDE